MADINAVQFYAAAVRSCFRRRIPLGKGRKSKYVSLFIRSNVEVLYPQSFRVFVAVLPLMAVRVDLSPTERIASAQG